LETALLIIGGLVMLVIGGELLVRGSVRVAEQLGVSPLLIGLTLVGFGTSTPELVTSIQAALIGSSGIAVGNIVGSNMANTLLILGISALLVPLAVGRGALRRDGVIGLLASLLFLAAAWTTGLSRGVGAGLVLLLILYLIYAYFQERSGGADHTAAYDRAEAVEGVDPALRPQAAGAGTRAWMVPVLTALGGLAIIVFGGRFLVSGAVDFARLVGMSEAAIGLTVVAVGTSMPELVTSVVAAWRRQADVAIGNILGSNIYNLLGIGGLTGLIAPTAIPAEIASFDLPLMVGATLLLLVFAATGARLSRIEGAVLLGAYLAYMAWLLMGL
jgi:cation:H+ antiporter